MTIKINRTPSFSSFNLSLQHAQRHLQTLSLAWARLELNPHQPILRTWKNWVKLELDLAGFLRWGICSSSFQVWPFGTGRTVHHFGRREGGVIVVLHIPGFSLLVLVHRAKGWPVTCPRRYRDLDSALPAFWPDSLTRAELWNSSMTAWLLCRQKSCCCCC